MKDIFELLHETDDTPEDLPETELTDIEKCSVLNFIKKKEQCENFNHKRGYCTEPSADDLMKK